MSHAMPPQRSRRTRERAHNAPGRAQVPFSPGALYVARSTRSGLADSSAASRRRIVRSRLVLLGILLGQAALTVRVRNTVYQDEAAYLTAGRLEWLHLLHGTPIAQYGFPYYFSGAPVLYPMLGAIGNSIGGLAGARAISLLAMLGATALLYSMTRLLFNERTGLYAAALFAVTEATLYMGNLATFDAAAVFLLALASWIVVRTAPRHGSAYLLATPVAALAAATKYAALGFVLPIPVLAALAAVPYHGRRALLRPVAFVAGTAAIIYVVVLKAGSAYWQGITSTTLSRAQGYNQPSVIEHDFVLWGALPFAIAVIGSVAYAVRAPTSPAEDIAPAGGPLRRTALGVTLAGSALIAPLHQMQIHDATAFQKHVGFGLLFAAPMAGVALARMVGIRHRSHRGLRGFRIVVAAAVFACSAVLGIKQAAVTQSWWPRSSQMAQVMARYLRPGGRYLVEAPEVAAYDLMNHSDAQFNQFYSTYAISYTDRKGKTVTGNAGYTAAIRAGYFEFVEYNFVNTPNLDELLAKTLHASHEYRLVAVLPQPPVGGSDCKTSYVCSYIWVKQAPKRR
jgi:4-amino-4-deoxy-L-arabinose transferase-like glycosyltransferase